MSSPFEPAPRTFLPPPPPPPPAPANGLFSVSEPTPVALPELVTGPSEGTVINGVAPKKAKKNRLNLDSLFVLIFTTIIVFALMVTSFIASFAAIIDVAQYTGLPQQFLWVFPVFIDMAILAYTLSLFIFTHRGESRWRTLMGLFGFALLSIAANVVHTVSFWNGDITSYQAWIGIVLTGAAPIAVLLASEEIGRLAFSKETAVDSE